MNQEVTQVCGVMLTVIFEAKTPDSAPSLSLVDLSSQKLGTAFSGSLYLSAAPSDPNTGLPYDLRRKIAIVHGDPVDGPTDVITLPFQIPTDAPGGTLYTVSVTAAANDWQGVKMPVTAAIGTVTVTGTLYGDINNNGNVEVSDAVLALQAATELITLTADELTRGDMNKNGRIEVSDAVAILRRAVGLG